MLKKAKFKKIISLVLSIVFVLSLLTMPSSANPSTYWCLTHRTTGCTHCANHTIINVGTQTATCSQPGGQIRICMSGCGHTFYQTAPLEHNNLTGTNRICTRATSCGNVRDSTTGWHYMFRVGNMATKVSEGYPEYNSGGLHEGIDIIHSTWGLVNNMPVYSVGSGTINYAGWYGGGYGNVVQLKIGSNIVWYTHLGNNTINVSYGMSVKEDRLLGRVGDTQSPGAFHLHFEIRNSNNAKNGGASEFDPRDWYPQSGVFTY